MLVLPCPRNPVNNFVAAAINCEAQRRVLSTFSDWESLSSDERDEVLEDMEYSPQFYPNLRTTAEVQLSDLDAPMQSFAGRMMEAVEDLEPDNDEFPTVGPPVITFQVITLTSGEILGGSIRVFQKGASIDDEFEGEVEEASSFGSAEEAIAAGYDPSADVSWGATARLDHELEFVGSEPYSLEWSGW